MCRQLDQYVHRHRLGPPWPQVAKAYKVQSMRNELAAAAAAGGGGGGGGSEVRGGDRLRREAADILLSLFGVSAPAIPAPAPPRPSPRRASAAGAAEEREVRRVPAPATVRQGGLTVVDDDLAVASYSEGARGGPAAPTFEEVFPGLPASARRVEPIPWVEARRSAAPAPARPRPTGPLPAAAAPDAVLRRNMQLKAALGLADAGENLETAALERAFTVWPAHLQQWAESHRAELDKIERRLSAMLEDPRGTSVSLKPMPRAMRATMHEIATFYCLNSMSHEPEPRRYIRFVRTADSRVPWPLLSQAHRVSGAALSHPLPCFLLPVSGFPVEKGREGGGGGCWCRRAGW